MATLAPSELTLVAGLRHHDFSMVFSLAEAAVETSHFVGRQDELRQIRAHLRSDGVRSTVVLYGLGGIGKTQLAIAYAKRHKDDYSAVFWVNAKSEDAIRSSFVKVAKQIARERPSAPQLNILEIEQNIEGAIKAVKAWLSAPMNTRWLLICDNYDDPKVPGSNSATALELRHYLPEAYQGSVIITTRSAEVKLGHCIQIKKFEALQDSLEILEHSSGRQDLINGESIKSNYISRADIRTDSSAVQLIRKLDGLPLALATAGAYLSQSTTTFAEYLHLLELSWAKLQRHSPALMTYENGTLYSTWQVSFVQIEQRNMLSARLLRLWAYFNN